MVARKSAKKSTRKSSSKGKRKATARKSTARKATTRRKTTGRKKVAAKKATGRRTTTRKAAGKTKKVVTAIRQPLTKSGLLNNICEATGLARKDVGSVIEELGNVIERHLKKGGAGKFVLPGLIKCEVKRKPATKARKGINPFTGEMITFKAKPARNIVKVRALKKLKEMVG